MLNARVNKAVEAAKLRIGRGRRDQDGGCHRGKLIRAATLRLPHHNAERHHDDAPFTIEVFAVVIS